MAQTLEYNKNVTAVVPIEIPAFDDDLNVIQKLEDEPNDIGGLTANELKERFDTSGLAVQNYINNTLIPTVIAEGATEQSRQAAESERVVNETERVANEAERISAEEGRASGEAARVAAEQERAAAEEERKTSIVGYVERAEEAEARATEYAHLADEALNNILSISDSLLKKDDMDEIAQAVIQRLPVYAGEVENA